MKLVTEHLNHAFRFIFAHQAVVHMHAYQLLPDGPDQKRRHHGRIHAARQREKHPGIPYLAPDQLHLVFNEILHVPVRFRPAGFKYEGLQRFLIRLLLKLCFASGTRIIHRNHGIFQFIQLRPDFHSAAVHNSVFPSVKNDSLHIVQRLQLLHSDIVRMNLAVNPQIPDPARQHGVFRTSQIQNDNHVLFHFPPFSANQRFVRPPVRRHFIIAGAADSCRPPFSHSSRLLSLYPMWAGLASPDLLFTSAFLPLCIRLRCDNRGICNGCPKSAGHTRPRPYPCHRGILHNHRRKRNTGRWRRRCRFPSLPPF